ncbi:MAG: SDR family oxidoreductase [Alphaproteobacteria bacterium]|nr:SDR family oxidoreductase [Alphaproteobacteria bacterium]MCB9931707.1 SDR family oxidoreductase [Alphaproteobacteria bacterium]
MQNPFSMEGRNVLVTGAAQGIGRDVAKTVVGLGGRVAAVDLNADGIKSLKDELGDACLPYVGSVTDQGQTEQIVQDMVKEWGWVHGLFNNAGIVRAAMIHKMERETWDQVINVNLTGVYLTLQAVGRQMIAQANGEDAKVTNGQVVNVSSIAGTAGTIGQINYGAAKAGVLGITMSAAKEWARYGICVNSVAFGTVVTPMTEVIRGPKFAAQTMSRIPLGRYAETSDVSPTVIFLMSPGSTYITGKNVTIDGGITAM